MGPRGWSSPATIDEQAEYQREADRLVGQRIRAVRYIDIDHRQDDWAESLEGSRVISDSAEWSDPPWRYDGFDSVDHGVEIETTGDRYFTATWGPPGDHEGLDLREVRAVDHAVAADAGVAIWDVTRRGRWHPYLRRDITEVVLHYRHWWEAEYWCSHITLGFGGSSVDLLLADADHHGQICPSADNVAVVFDPSHLPAWR